MARCIKQVNRTALIRKLHHRRGDGDASLFLHFHPVRGGMAPCLTTFNRTRFLNRISEQQQLFGHGGLTRIGVRNNSEGAATGHFLINLAHRVSIHDDFKGEIIYHCDAAQ